MRNAVLIYVLIFTFSSMACAGSNKVATAWTPQPVDIDGDPSDWPDGQITFFPDDAYAIGTLNDSSHLYIVFRFRNFEWVRAIRLTGLTIWLDAKGKSREELALRYTGGPEPARGGEPVDARLPTGLPNQRPERGQPGFYFIEKERLVNTELPTDGSLGPKVAFDTLFGMVTYEFSIPFRKSVAGNYGIDLQPGQKFSIGLVWGDTDDLRSAGREKMRDDGPPGGMGGRPGGMADGPPGGMRGGRGMKIDKKEFWLKSTLATTPAEN